MSRHACFTPVNLQRLIVFFFITQVQSFVSLLPFFKVTLNFNGESSQRLAEQLSQVTGHDALTLFLEQSKPASSHLNLKLDNINLSDDSLHFKVDKIEGISLGTSDGDEDGMSDGILLGIKEGRLEGFMLGNALGVLYLDVLMGCQTGYC